MEITINRRIISGRELLSNQLFLGQIVAHFSILPMLLYAHWYHYAISFFVYFLTGCLGMSMTYHRLVSHRSWRAPFWFECVGTVLATLGLTGSSLAWCAVHREHHRRTDSEMDPHSPVQQPFWKVQCLSMFHRPRIRFMADILRSPLHRALHRHYWTVQFIYAGVLIMIDPFALVYAYLFPACILWHAGSCINTFGHLWGYRNFATNDHSRNNPLLGYFMWGEGWHNNHHAHPRASRFGQRWFELDLSAWIIQFLERPQERSESS